MTGVLRRRRRRVVEGDDNYNKDFTLLFNGGWLGEHVFDHIIFYWHPIPMLHADPKSIWFEAILALDGMQYPIWMRKVAKEKLNEIAFIDEMKELYGIPKIGTHTVALTEYPVQEMDEQGNYCGWGKNKNKAAGYYVCFRVNVGLTVEGNYDFKDPLPVTMIDDKDDKILDIIRRHLLFFELVGIHYQGIKQFIWINGDPKRLVSINLSLVDPSKKLKLPSADTTNHFFNRVWHKQETMERMFGFNADTYEEFYEQFEHSLKLLVTDYYPQRLHALPWIRQQFDRRMLVYYQSSKEVRVFIPDPTIDIMFCPTCSAPTTYSSLSHSLNQPPPHLSSFQPQTQLSQTPSSSSQPSLTQSLSQLQLQSRPQYQSQTSYPPLSHVLLSNPQSSDSSSSRPRTDSSSSYSSTSSTSY